MSGKVLIVGAGPAGLQAAATLRSLGAEPVLLEKDTEAGGKLRLWHKLFPTFTPSGEVLGPLLRAAEGIELRTGAEVAEVGTHGVTLATGERIDGDAIILSNGFELFRAELKEEYGYGLYDNVYTTVDIERMLGEGRVAMADGRKPSRIAFLHCVGSRDEKVGQKHCSRVCCVTGVKQAMELKELLPECEVHNFYMDIRMFGPGYEEMYRTAQEQYNLHFIRGRISEAAETMDRRIQVKAEDTLIGRPLKMTVDMLVLIVGMTSCGTNRSFSATEGIGEYPSGFLRPADQFAGNVCSGAGNIFYAGAVTAPKNIGESINEGTVAAHKVMEYLNGRQQ